MVHNRTSRPSPCFAARWRLYVWSDLWSSECSVLYGEVNHHHHYPSIAHSHFILFASSTYREAANRFVTASATAHSMNILDEGRKFNFIRDNFTQTNLIGNSFYKLHKYPNLSSSCRPPIIIIPLIQLYIKWLIFWAAAAHSLGFLDCTSIRNLHLFAWTEAHNE